MSDNSLMKAVVLDEKDPLKEFRDRFIYGIDLEYKAGSTIWKFATGIMGILSLAAGSIPHKQ